MNYPITPAIRVLRENKVEFEPSVFNYVEKGGARHSAEVLGVSESTIKRDWQMAKAWLHRELTR